MIPLVNHDFHRYNVPGMMSIFDPDQWMAPGHFKESRAWHLSLHRELARHPSRVEPREMEMWGVEFWNADLDVDIYIYIVI